MKFLVPNYSYLQNPWLGGYRPQIPVHSVLCPQLNLLKPPPLRKKFLTTPLTTMGSQNALWYMIYFGSVLCNAWWWLSIDETYCHEIILYNNWCVWLKHMYYMQYSYVDTSPTETTRHPDSRDYSTKCHKEWESKRKAWKICNWTHVRC